MTANAIVMKLNRMLSEPVDSECKVVYILCETRKLMDAIPPHQRPFALNMYCHWALHVDLHGRDTIGAFLTQVDDYVHGMLVGPEDIDASEQMLREFVFFEAFRSQLRNFWNRLGISTDLTDSNSRWRDFVEHYAGVIEDGSLSFHSPGGLRYVEHVRFEKGRNAVGEFTHLPFEMNWVVALQNGRTADIVVSVRPPRDGVSEMISTGFHLR